MEDRDSLLQTAIAASIKAGQAILEVYNQPVLVEIKDDRSPLTEADKRSHDIIFKDLVNSNFPILSEEGKQMDFSERKAWKKFWMVDPLDGTKEFIKKNGEFTVNIALIRDQKAIMGVIYAPVLDTLYFSEITIGSYKLQASLKEFLSIIEGDYFLVDLVKRADRLPVGNASDEITVVASRSHLNEETTDYIEKIKAKHIGKEINFVSKGSSLKICLVAEGSAHIYPRLAPTMEWDTAAGQAIAECAGKKFYDFKSGEPMKYNKANLLNEWFVVEG
ncbi:MAG: 3'(2'),5'-bisphosphate nucleotidase CysQ [Bacteroidia bacterium]|nr:3'(2'),5'-bisphosphate nucleotidase CysQ [Bacteroidia bacterium]